MNDYLPKGYEPPKTGSGDYLVMKEPKDYRVRILTKPTIGYEAWTHENKPKRKKNGDNWELGNYKGTPAEFWSFIVWSYEEERFQVFTTTKRGLINAVYDLVQNSDWGDPTKYDVKLVRQGTTKEDTKL